MQQIVVIHGGNTFLTHEAYLSDLQNRKIDLDRYRFHSDWKARLQETLGTEYDVLAPRMPNASDAQYAEWALLFKKILPLLDDNLILVGHSLGASFLVRYLSEEQVSKRIRATFIVAGAYSTDMEDMTSEFAAPSSLALFEQQSGHVFLYHSKDDPVVPFSELQKYQAALPNATARVFEDRQHFNQETFPELIADIRSIEV